MSTESIDALISDLLKHVSESENLAQRFFNVEQIPKLVRASILSHVRQTANMIRTMARELEALQRHRQGQPVT